VILILKKIL